MEPIDYDPTQDSTLWGPAGFMPQEEQDATIPGCVEIKADFSPELRARMIEYNRQQVLAHQARFAQQDAVRETRHQRIDDQQRHNAYLITKHRQAHGDNRPYVTPWVAPAPVASVRPTVVTRSPGLFETPMDFAVYGLFFFGGLLRGH